jgi:hypothetical protein
MEELPPKNENTGGKGMKNGCITEQKNGRF